MSGMMLMYVITLGSYFNYALKHEIFSSFKDYSLFRKNTRAVINHSIVMIGQAVFSIFSLIINYNMGRFQLIIAVLIPIIMLVFHMLTGFGKVENLVNSAEKLKKETINKYLMWNIPLHILYASLYMISAILLLTLFK